MRATALLCAIGPLWQLAWRTSLCIIWRALLVIALVVGVSTMFLGRDTVLMDWVCMSVFHMGTHGLKHVGGLKK